MRELLVVGDIHGDIKKLRKLKSEFSSTQKIIFLGDYVNLGKYSKEVIEELIQLRSEFDCSFLMGNHDISLLKYLDGKIEFIEFATLGGIPTILSYLKRAKGNVREQLKISIPDSHIEFLINLEPFIETEKYFISHSGLNVEKPNSRNIQDLINNNKFSEQENLLQEKTIICGHFVQKNLKPYISKHLICLDTGCGTIKNGILTSLILPEKRIITIS